MVKRCNGGNDGGKDGGKGFELAMLVVRGGGLGSSLVGGGLGDMSSYSLRILSSSRCAGISGRALDQRDVPILGGCREPVLSMTDMVKAVFVVVEV